jgi:hypothetical protein
MFWRDVMPPFSGLKYNPNMEYIPMIGEEEQE